MSDEIEFVLGVDFMPGPRLVEIVAASLHREEYGLWWLSTEPIGRDYFGAKRRRQARRRRMARKKRRGW